MHLHLGYRYIMSRNISIKFIVISLVISFSLILFTIFVINSSSTKKENGIQNEISSNVIIENDTQIITVTSKMGGYVPKIIYAKSAIPTVLKIESVNSYGCERAFTIPSLNISEELPNNGTTTFDLKSPQKDILGTCSMGMYTFLIKFI